MRVTFVLPSYSDRPIGGFKVVYEYASRLQAHGHRVTVIHPNRIQPQESTWAAVKARRWTLAEHRPGFRLVTWFAHHPGVRLRLVPDLRERFIPDGDAIFATAWQTAEWVAGYGPRAGAKYYLIQSYETWAGPKTAVDETWRLPLHKVVIARWLRDFATTLGEEQRTTYIPNGIDLEHFRIDEPIEHRNPHRIGMLYHRAELKRVADGVAALTQVRQSVPDIETVCFGTTVPNGDLPDWVEYVENPTPGELRALYNSCAIFLHPSRAEGWPLPPAEAMACGCALVAAANDGVKDYAMDGETALLAPIMDPIALADRLLTLLQDDALRQRFAQSGHTDIQQYTWARALVSMEELLSS